ncbi:MAG: hypothetical protein PWQ57_2927 [Desulfovibrionales bacterium]|jgi:hypothetical protein|nr:hypothetical protein [Desulfovibrionales bacterium]
MLSSRRSRTDAFRRSHREGQKVRGVFRRWEAPELGWVEIDGHWLLARLGGEIAPGQGILFEIVELSPDIVLRQTGQPRGESGLAGDACQELAMVRVQLEASEAWANAETAPDQASFLRALSQDQEASKLLARILGLQETVNQALAGRASFGYVPWLLPGARRVEMLVLGGASGSEPSEGGDPDVLLGLELPHLGAARIHFTTTGAGEAFRVLLERFELRDAFLQFLETQTELLNGAVCMGVHPLPADAAPGVLGELMRLLRPQRRLDRHV